MSKTAEAYDQRARVIARSRCTACDEYALHHHGAWHRRQAKAAVWHERYQEIHGRHAHQP